MDGKKRSAAHAVCGSTGGRKGDSFCRAVSVVSIAKLRRKVKSEAVNGEIRRRRCRE